MFLSYLIVANQYIYLFIVSGFIFKTFFLFCNIISPPFVFPENYNFTDNL